MSFSPYASLLRINPSKIQWEIRVRAQAIWKGITRETNEFRGLNLVLVDESVSDYIYSSCIKLISMSDLCLTFFLIYFFQSCRMHAFINARFAGRFLENLKEGEIYCISNFIVQDYTGLENHRLVRFSRHIYFGEYTRVEKISDPQIKMLLWSFDLFSLSDLEKYEGDKRYLFGIIFNLY